MGVEVLSHALFPEVASETDSAKLQQAVTNAITNVTEATNQLSHFFVAAMYGFMRSRSAVRHEVGSSDVIQFVPAGDGKASEE